ncbi:bifunctional 2-C-methyl-D-erythritol 4-phosphate cytidylyltransferase/2-C-methyl-D-erythritol 2,4-cyclodiphosphate synthase [Chelatococcus sp. SYSU_G07232]|uniref:Bifunctional enzyme IspD/IspF n=1 Tax=Chelatococcus albus TaxID=3047466 RepID=A0ABT7ABU3_9HYPH|nr:bifunctional 2-C-methyl-D-erythritol 4-phosphate cytidylyltransferase/2-C-methyl-D-erythritol 2,4-cyclodiphosphate synthase [Chelatococcus sp. SYSU_G07232]MDJ1156830.1 bifunctional 2-C-methyl-D-erythritol 4-phosphate cytidylyltransferase/2-C-methyl-D-erythritol 2,4-cyclodiphosphate synthase [Chelatococcus sp. SYSU_G07232]
MSSVAAIIVAAGRGTRAGGDVPKQYRELAGRPVLARTLETFLAHPGLAAIVPVIHPEDAGRYGAVAAGLSEATGRLRAPVSGGDSRQASVLAGLEALAVGTMRPEIVLVHDAARPFATSDLIDRAIAAARAHGAAVPGVTVTDTVKVVDDAGLVRATPERAALRLIQTPQAFRFDDLLSAHRQAASLIDAGFTDDGAIAEWAGLGVHVFPGEPANMKLTTAADFDEAERRLAAEAPALGVRVGCGYDVHAFAAGDHLWLGGIRIAHDRGVLAHSDGDVVLHALTDAVLGALAEGDIGTHFPPSDPQWKGASSDRFLAHAMALLRQRGGRLDHADVTVVCEAPKIGPHREAMRRRIADIVGLPLSAVSIKATTSERLGFTGRREGIAAQAIATVRLPFDREP